ncbi:MAG: acyl-CoA dehydrogenase [Burkholderiales bacterium]|nr:acyl-CoA dehydrogenase [Burkholderiales bacterium]
MDDLHTSGELRLLADSVAAFTRQESNLARMRAWRGQRPGYDRELWRRMAGMGWAGILVPEKFGGAGLGFAHMRIVAQGLARVLAPEPLIATAVLAARAMVHGTNEALQQAQLPALAAGERMVALAWQDGPEPPGSDARATAALADGEGFVVSGTKRYVVPADGVDAYIIAARTREDPLLLWVPADSAGLRTEAQLRSDGTYCQTLDLDGVRVPAAHVLASGDAAQAALARAIDEANALVAAELLAGMERALAIALDYLQTRVQFGRAIGSFQALQHRAVDLWMQKELAIGAVDDAMRALDTAHDARQRALAVSRAKSRCADAALLITRESIKLHGAIGYADECDVGQYLQRALVLSAWLGNGANHRRRYARLADALPRITRSTPHATPESPPDTDWNALCDEAFRHEVRSFFEAYYPSELRYLQRRARWSETRDWALLMSKKGWIAPAWPREHGGMGLTPAKFIIFVEEQERWGIARAPDMGILMLGPVLIRFGTEAQKRAYLPKIIACEHVWCQGYSEPNAGSDLASLKTSAVADGDDYVINGSKIWTSGALDADHMFMLARTDASAKRQEGISFFVLDLKTPGIRMRPIRNLSGQEEFCQEFFDDVRIPKENLVGELNKGWTVAKALLGFERLNNGSPRRVQYPLLKLASIARARGVWEDAEFQSKYTQLRLDAADLASAYQRFAEVVRQGGTPGPESSFLKVWSGETLQRLAQLSVETAGEDGAIRGVLDFDDDAVDILGSFYHLFGATTASGTNDIQRNIIAKRVLALPS